MRLLILFLLLSLAATGLAAEEAADQSLRTLRGHGGRVNAVAFSPDGQMLVSGSMDATLKLWNVASGTEIRTLSGHTVAVTAVAFSPDGRTLVSGGVWGRMGTLTLWDTVSGAEIRTLIEERTEHIYAVAFSPDGRTIVSGSENTLKLWDAGSGKEIYTIQYLYRIFAVAFSPNGQTIVSGSWDTLKLWDADSGRGIHTLSGQTVGGPARNVHAVAFNPDGRTIVSGGDTLKLWDATSGKEIRTFGGHTGDVNAVAFSPDGRMLVSGSMDATLKLWNVASGTEILTLHGHTEPVNAVAFSPNGRTLVSGSWDNTLKLWDMQEFMPRLLTFPPLAPSSSAALTGTEIDTMQRLGVKAAFEGEKQPQTVSLSLTPQRLAQAEFLDFSHLNLKALPNWLGKFTQLRKLNLSGNRLTLPALAPLRGMVVLEVLDVSNNPLFDQYYAGIAPLLQHLPNLRNLNLARTGGSADNYGDLSALSKLLELNLSGNHIGGLQELNLNRLKALRELNLSGNLLNGADFSALAGAAVEVLDISGNGIAELDLAGFKESGIKSLNLSKNKLEKLKLSDDVPALERLNLSQQDEHTPPLVLDENFGEPFWLQKLVVLDLDSDTQVPEILQKKLEALKQ